MAGAEEYKIRQYLLGRLTEAEEEQVELRLLTEPDFSKEYDIVVNELTDSYVAGKFEGEDLKQVEEYFFKSRERRNKLKFALALNRYATTAHQRERKFFPASWRSQSFLFRAAAAAASVVVLVGALWFLRQRTSSPETLATLTLNVSASNRGEETNIPKVALPPNIDALKIVLKLPEQRSPATRYRVELENINGEKRTLEPASQDPQSVTVVVRSADLKPGQYSLKLLAVNSDGGEQRIAGNYFFTVE